MALLRCAPPPKGAFGTPVQRDCCARTIFVPGEPAAAAAQILLARFDICSGRLAELYASG